MKKPTKTFWEYQTTDSGNGHVLYTEEAKVFNEKVRALLSPIVKEYLELGYPPQEVEHLLMRQANLTVIEHKYSMK